MILRGRYVTLRPLTVADAELTLAWRLSEKASVLNRGATTIDEQREWIQQRGDNELDFVIEAPGPVGTISLIVSGDPYLHAESARLLMAEPAKPYVVAEAEKLLHGLAFDTLGLSRVYCLIPVSNAKALKWNTFLGYTEENRFADYYALKGKPQTAICLGMNYRVYSEILVPRCNLLIGLGGAK